MTKDKTTTAIAMLLMLSFAISLVALPAVNAHDPPWTIPSFAYLVCTPNPVGVGQQITLIMFVDTPMPSAAITNDIRRHDYTITITNPNGKTDTQHWDYIADSTGIMSYQYVPDVVGTYTAKFDYGGQTYTWSGTNQNDTFAATSTTETFTVQEEQLPPPQGSYPLPTEYWTRPIEGQNTEWYTISSNWLRDPFVTTGGTTAGGIQTDGIAPNSPHVMWSKPIQYGGVVGGNDTTIPGENYYMGGSYNVRFSNALIMYGVLYYSESYGNSGGGGDYVAVDLRTGAELWRLNTTAGGVPSFGYVPSYDSPNQHGILPNGLLFAHNDERD
jgi:hypothetical protein